MKTPRILLTITAFATLFMAGCMRVNTSGSFTIPENATHRGTLISTSGLVTLEKDARVTGTVLMTSGSLVLEEGAVVEGDVVMTSGELVLGHGALIEGAVYGASGRVIRAETARIVGGTGGSFMSLGVRWLGTACLAPVLITAGGILLVAGRARGMPQRRAARRSRETVRQLMDLKAWREADLISDAEYERKKSEILSGLHA